MKLQFKIILHPNTDMPAFKTDFTLEANLTEEQHTNFKIPELAFKIEQALNEHVKGIRVHADIIDN